MESCKSEKRRWHFEILRFWISADGTSKLVMHAMGLEGHLKKCKHKGSYASSNTVSSNTVMQ